MAQVPLGFLIEFLEGLRAAGVKALNILFVYNIVWKTFQNTLAISALSFLERQSVLSHNSLVFSSSLSSQPIHAPMQLEALGEVSFQMRVLCLSSQTGPVRIGNFTPNVLLSSFAVFSRFFLNPKACVKLQIQIISYINVEKLRSANQGLKPRSSSQGTIGAPRFIEYYTILLIHNFYGSVVKMLKTKPLISSCMSVRLSVLVNCNFRRIHDFF